MFIIYGTKAVTSVVGNGEFLCPGCGGALRRYLRQEVTRYFTLFFLPLVPTGRLPGYLECETCGGQFDERVLLDLPKALEAKARADGVEHARRVLVHAATAGGNLGSAVLGAVRDGYRGLGGGDLSDADLKQELNLARLARAGLADYPRRLDIPLDEPTREAIVGSALSVLIADAPLNPAERTFLDEITAESGLNPARLRAILAAAGIV